MELYRGLQPNCSELIIRLDDRNIEEIRDSLKSIGIVEAVIKGLYQWELPEIGDWDDEKPIANRSVIPVEDLPIRVVEIIREINSCDSRRDYKSLRKELKDLGYKDISYDIELVDGENLPDWKNGGIIRLYDDFNEDGPAIVGHQHCQVQIFPAIKKISEYFGEEVEANDGGDIDSYESWLNGEEPNDED